MIRLLTKPSSQHIPSKYFEVRENIENGDIILYRGTSILSKCIQYFDKATYNHIGIVWKYENRLLTLDMWSGGLTLTPLSNRMKGVEDFCILRPKKVSLKKIQFVINMALDQWEGHVGYDTLLLLRIAIIKKTGLDINGLGEKKKFICSEFVQDYVKNLDIDLYKEIKLITPEDFLRYSTDKEFITLYK